MLALAASACEPAARPAPAPIVITEIGRAPDPVPPPQAAPPAPPTLAVAVDRGPAGLAARRDPRLGRRAPRAVALLVTELQGLESLFAATSRESPDRPKLVLRLADGYVELGQAAASRGTSAHDAKIVVAARAAAAKYYKLLSLQYGQWCGGPRGGCGDEVLYYLALDDERGGDLNEARKAYLELLQRFPQSPFCGPAYFGFGEMFLAEARQDPSKLSLAEQSYDEAARSPPPGNRLWGWAQYRLAEVHEKRGDVPRALSYLDKAAAHAAAEGDASGLGAAVEAMRGQLGQRP